MIEFLNNIGYTRIFEYVFFFVLGLLCVFIRDAIKAIAKKAWDLIIRFGKWIIRVCKKELSAEERQWARKWEQKTNPSPADKYSSNSKRDLIVIPKKNGKIKKPTNRILKIWEKEQKEFQNKMGKIDPKEMQKLFDGMQNEINSVGQQIANQHYRPK